jgi:group I intron endonuclease
MIIYKTTNLINGKIYIGKDKHDNPKYLGSGKRLNSAIQKYGQESFLKEIIEYCNSEKHMLEREKYWINHFDSTNRLFGYNLTKGGEGGDTFTLRSDIEKNQTRKLLSAASSYWNNINRKKHSENTKRLWQDPVYAQKVKDGVNRSNQNPDIIAKRRRIMKEVCNTTEARAIRSKNSTGMNNSTWKGYADLYDIDSNFVKRYECIGYLKKDYPLCDQNNIEIKNGDTNITIKSSRKRKLEYEGYQIKIIKEVK